jgi:hypothetical protein
MIVFQLYTMKVRKEDPRKWTYSTPRTPASVPIITHKYSVTPASPLHGMNTKHNKTIK